MSAPTAVLFDVPGPRARARNTVAGAVTLAVVLALLGVLVWRLAATGQLDARVWEWVLYENVQLAILDGLIKTLQAFATGAVLALALGALLALGGSRTTARCGRCAARSSSCSAPCRSSS